MPDGRIEYQVRADTSNVSSDLDGVSSALESGSSKWSGIIDGAKKRIGEGLVEMAASAVKSSYQLATGFEDGMAKVSTLMDTSVTDMSKVSSGLLGLSSQFGISANDMAAAAYNAVSSYTKFATDSDGLMKVLSQSATLAKAGFTDIDTAASATLKTMNAYGLGLQSVDMIQKVLIQTQNNGITTVGELGSVLSNVTPTAAAMGVSFQQVGAALATMTAQGTPAAQATTQLNSMFAELGKSGTTASNALKSATEGTQYAGMSFQQLMAAGVPMNEVLQLMSDYAARNGKSLLDMFGSVEAGKAALAMTGENAQSFTNNLHAMSTEADVVGESFSKVSGTTSEKLQQMLTSLQSLLIQLFQACEPLVTTLLNLAQSVMPVVSAAFQGIIAVIKPVIEWLSQIVTYVSSTFGPQLTSAFDGVKSSISTAWEGVKGIFSSLVSWLDTSIVQPIKSALDKVNIDFTGFHDTISKAWENIKAIFTAVIGWLGSVFGGQWSTQCEKYSGIFRAFGDAISTIWQAIKGVFSAAIQFITATFGALFKGAMQVLAGDFEGFGKTISEYWENIKGVFKSVGDWIGNTFSGIWKTSCDTMSTVFGGFRDAIGTAWEGIKTGFSAAGSWLSDTFTGIWKGACNAWDTAFSDFKTSCGTIWDGIKNFFSGAMSFLNEHFAAPFKSMWEGISGFFGNVFEGLKAKFTGPINWIIDKLNSFIDDVNKVKIPDWVPAVGGLGFSIPHIPRLKIGMDYVPTDGFPALLHKGEAVLTAAEAAEWRGGQSRSAGNGIDAEQLASMIADMMSRVTIPVYLDGREVGRGVEPYVSSTQADRYNSRRRAGGF